MVADHQKEDEYNNQEELTLAKFTDSVCKLCRREGMKLFLKASRCSTDKCAFDRRSYSPGQHGAVKKKPTDYSLHLREKQKVKRTYGILERQFWRYYLDASRMKGNTGENLLCLLERRLDNVVFRLGFARSLKEARQMVNHGHILVNNRKVNVPSYLVKKGDVISVKEKSKNLVQVAEGVQNAPQRVVPVWLSLNATELKGEVKNLPLRTDIALPVQEQLIVEFYSR
jgi:small subunit ribosomal protein S4